MPGGVVLQRVEHVLRGDLAQPREVTAVVRLLQALEVAPCFIQEGLDVEARRNVGNELAAIIGCAPASPGSCEGGGAATVSLPKPAYCICARCGVAFDRRRIKANTATPASKAKRSAPIAAPKPPCANSQPKPRPAASPREAQTSALARTIAAPSPVAAVAQAEWPVSGPP